MSISILVVDDDLNKIASIVKTIREVYAGALTINQASCVQEAVERLETKEYHLLITDLLMPLKSDSAPDPKGGKALVKSLYRRNTLNVPMYVVGLTQYSNIANTLGSIWMVWLFEAESEEWRNNLRELIKHISLIKTRILSPKIETIYVEGYLDKIILEATFSKHHNDFKHAVSIENISYGGGASWVVRQLFIWAQTLARKHDSYLRAVGIFDNDTAGLSAITRLNKSIQPQSAEALTYAVIKTSYKYSPLLKAIKNKGVTFPTTIEDLIGQSCWEHAENVGWLENRDVTRFNLEDQAKKLGIEGFTRDSLISHGFNENEIRIMTMRINETFKESFIRYAIKTNSDDALIYLGYLVKDCLIKLKLFETEVPQN